MWEKFNQANENMWWNSLENKESFSGWKKSELEVNYSQNANKLKEIQLIEQIDKEIWDHLDKLNISEEDKEKIYEKLLHFSENEKLVNKTIKYIKFSKSIDDVYTAISYSNISYTKQQTEKNKYDINNMIKNRKLIKKNRKLIKKNRKLIKKNKIKNLIIKI